MLKTFASTTIILSALAFSAVTAEAASYGMLSSHTKKHPVVATMSSTMAAPAKRFHTSKGTIWVDDRGYALYTYGKDTAGTSNCMGGCAVAWPPFRAALGAQASGRWSLVSRFMGTKQWAYDGHPLYFWFKDTKPGVVTGDNVDGFHVAR